MKEALSPKAAEIVSHARTLLETGGYNGFSYADIAVRVNISKVDLPGYPLGAGSFAVAAGEDSFEVKLLEPVADVNAISSGKANLRLAGDLNRWAARPRSRSRSRAK